MLGLGVFPVTSFLCQNYELKLPDWIRVVPNGVHCGFLCIYCVSLRTAINVVGQQSMNLFRLTIFLNSNVFHMSVIYEIKTKFLLEVDEFI